MHSQQQPGTFGDGMLVVGDARAIGGPDLAQHRARFRHHVGNAERAADLDQFAARHQHLAALGQRVQRQQHRSGIVVDDDGRDFARRRVQQFGEQAIDVNVTLAALASREIEFQVRVALRNFGSMFQRSWLSGSASEVGVQDDAGRVDDRAQRVSERLLQLLLYPAWQVIKAGLDLHIVELAAAMLARSSRSAARTASTVALRPFSCASISICGFRSSSSTEGSRRKRSGLAAAFTAGLVCGLWACDASGMPEWIDYRGPLSFARRRPACRLTFG